MLIEIFGEYVYISQVTHSTGNDYVCPFLWVENIVDSLARILAVSYFGYHSTFLFWLGEVAKGFAPQMRMIRILVPLATPPYIIVTTVAPSGIITVMSETDSSVDFVEPVEWNTKKGEKRSMLRIGQNCRQQLFSFGRQDFPLKSVEDVVEL